MKEHTWVTEEIDGGTVGTDTFWVCSDCGVSGGVVVETKQPPTMDPFLAGTGLDMPLDCTMAKAIIQHTQHLHQVNGTLCATIERAKTALRFEYKPPDSSKEFECERCEYIGVAAFIDREGSLGCPICEGGGDVEVYAEVLMILERT